MILSKIEEENFSKKPWNFGFPTSELNQKWCILAILVQFWCLKSKILQLIVNLTKFSIFYCIFGFPILFSVKKRYLSPLKSHENPVKNEIKVGSNFWGISNFRKYSSMFKFFWKDLPLKKFDPTLTSFLAGFSWELKKIDLL